MKFGKVVIVGRPNTGKSTLINAIMGQKVAITSPMPQTTRRSRDFLFNGKRGSFIISDTPGIMNKVRDLMAKKSNLETPKTTHGAEVLVMVVDISREKNEEENKVIGMVRKSAAKKVLVYNKIDKAVGTKDHLAEYNYLEEEFDKVISVSALKEKYVLGLIDEIFDLLPEIPDEKAKVMLENYQSDKPAFGDTAKEFVAEIIREKAYLFLRRELPYSITVEVESIEDKKKILVIKASILTNTERYKKMIIGSGGKKIKEIGYNARKELELATDRKVFLELQVGVDKHWMERVGE